MKISQDLTRELPSVGVRELVALLVLGADIESRRVVPFPHRAFVRHVGVLGDVELFVPEPLIQRLVDDRVLAGRPVDALWDRIAYSVQAPATLQALARKDYFPCGFGQCPVCGEFPLKAGRRANAPPHGACKDTGTPPCGGSGSPLKNTALVVVSPEAKRVA